MEKTQHINGDRPLRAAEPPPPLPMTSFDPRVIEDIDAVLSVAFAEIFAGFKRSVDPKDGSTLWHRTDANTEAAVSIATDPIEIDKLPPVRGSGYMLMGYLDQFCTELTANDDEEGANVLWQMQRMLPQEPSPYKCIVVRVKDGLGLPLGTGTSNDPAVAIAAAMLGVAHLDYNAFHKELYPGKWLD